MSSGTLVAFKIFAFPRADARWVAALPDAVYASVRLRRVVRGTGLLSDQPRLEYVPNRRAADPHAGRRYGRLPLPHDAPRPAGAGPYAARRCRSLGLPRS